MRRAVGLFFVLAGLALGVAAAAWPVAAQVSTIPGVSVPTVTSLTVPLEVTVPTLATVPTTVPSTVSTVVDTATSVLPEVTVPTVPTLPGVTVPGVTTPTLPVATTLPGGVNPDAVIDCTDFLTQNAAQLALSADQTLAGLLDADGDGRACEFLPPLGGTPAGSPNGGVSPVGSNAGGTVVAASSGAGGGTSSTAAAGSPNGGGETSRSGSSPRGSASGAGRGSGQGGGLGAAPAAAVDGLAPDGDDGVAHVALKVIAFAMLLSVTAAAAANRDLFVDELLAARSVFAGPRG